jgi:hypothetical protein
MKRWLIRLIIFAVLGFVARKLMTSPEPKKQKVGRTLGRLVGATPATATARR